MHCHNKNTTDREELLSTAAQPPAYETVVTPSQQQQQQQQVPPTVIVNNTTVIHPIQQVPIISLPVELRDQNRFCSDTLKAVRRVFIRNLFLVIAAQFLVIDGIIAVLIYVPQVHNKMIDKRNSSYLFYIIWFVSMVMLAIISCWERIRRIPPANQVTIIVFTICQGIMLGCAATFKIMSLVLLASVGTTGIVCLATSLFQFQDRYYLSNFRSVLYVWTLNATCFGISLSFLDYSEAEVAAALSTLFCTYLVVNAQMMVHGTTRYVLNPKEYVFGAMNIYVDIVYVILVCLGRIGICGCKIFSCGRACEN